jgi:membrane-bound lytic murein transglycosylase D
MRRFLISAVLFSSFLVLGLVSGCASNPQHVGKPIPQDHLAEIQRPDIPLVVNDRVQDWLDYFQGNGRERYGLFLSRSAKYVPMMRKILKQHGLPENLVYLSMIESGFNPHAYSSARATGAWQFIYQTGTRYGLKADSWVDERRDPEKSTVAAAKYLKDLYDRYNNWYLAAASYNAGEGKIDRAIRKYATEDFWEMSSRKYKYLKRETKDYVPKLIAAALIAKNPEKYGFTGIVYETPITFDEVVVEGPIDLRVAAKCADRSYEEVKTLNPELIHWVTPPTVKEYVLKVPKGSGSTFRRNYADLPPEERMGDQQVTIKKSESVQRIAKKQGVSSALLALANGLSTGETVSAGSVLVIPYAPPAGESFSEKNYTSHRSRHSRGGGKTTKSRAHRSKRNQSQVRQTHKSDRVYASMMPTGPEKSSVKKSKATHKTKHSSSHKIAHKSGHPAKSSKTLKISER